MVNIYLWDLTNKSAQKVEPIFPTEKIKEQFYVRSGPASIELPTNKAIKYIKDRKKDI